MRIEVYDPPMCCSTGVCGTDADDALVRFAADLDWLARQGVEVRRYNLSQEPQAFTGNEHVARLLNETAGEALPVILADGQVVSQSVYPTRDQLGGFAGLGGAASSLIQLGGESDADEGCCGPSGCC